MTNLKLYWKSSIALRILSWLLAVSLLPLLIAGFISVKTSENEIKSDAIENLTAIADSKGKMFTDYIIRKESDVKALALTPIIATALEKYTKAYLEKGTDSSEYFALDSEYIKFFAPYVEAFGYHDLFLISHAGDIVFTVVREADFGTNLYTGDYKDTELARVFTEAIKFGKSNISNFKFYVPSDEPAAFIGAPIVRGDTKIGVVIFQMKNKDIYREVQDYIGLGETGEIVIASREGNEAVFIAPLRHDPEAAFARRVALGSTEAFPIQKSILQESGSGLSIDYRNKEILAVWRYLPHLRWGMVIKMDTDEAYKHIYNLRKWTIFIAITAVFVVILIAFRISRSISKPIKDLHRGSEIIGSGNLDYKVGTVAKDEIGELSRSFDKMTCNLKKSITMLEDEVIERKQAEEKLEYAVKELVRSNSDLEEFAYIASHDLKSPLLAISASVRMLTRKYNDKLDRGAYEYIDYITNSTERMNKLIDDLLAYSRIGVKSSKNKSVDVNKIFIRAIANLAVEIEKNGAKVTHDSLPTVIGNDIQLEQLMQNLIGNAIKFQNQEPPRVHISVEQKGENWVFSVKDNGIGIACEDKDRIFNMFQSLHGGEYKGSGIGLAVCRKIVKLHGGNIWVESQSGKGSTFYFTIPKRQDL